MFWRTVTLMTCSLMVNFQLGHAIRQPRTPFSKKFVTMISAILPAKEAERLAELYSYKILDSEPEQDFTDIVELASYICQTPVSLISLVDNDRQWFKAKKGIDESEMPRSISFCAHTITTPYPMIVPDARKDARFEDNPLVVGSDNFRFYAGFPLVTASGNSLGSLCVLDQKPRTLDAAQLKALDLLSRQVIALMDERVKNNLIKEIRDLEKQHSLGLEKLITTQRRIMSILGHDTRAPLHAINRLVQQAAAGRVSAEDMVPYYDLIGNQLDATLIIIDNLIAWGKSHVSPGSHEGKRFIVQRIVEETFELLRHPAANKHIELINKVEENVFHYANSQMIAFILRNLVSNGIKFTEKGQITVEAHQLETHLQLIVSDTGIGMTEQQIGSYLAASGQSSAGTRQETGSGLAVALINEFLAQHGGKLNVKSILGKGTEVTVSLAVRK